MLVYIFFFFVSVVSECCFVNKNQAVSPRLLNGISGAEREGAVTLLFKEIRLSDAQPSIFQYSFRCILDNAIFIFSFLYCMVVLFLVTVKCCFLHLSTLVYGGGAGVMLLN